jgi:hypothetical protein
MPRPSYPAWSVQPNSMQLLPVLPSPVSCPQPIIFLPPNAVSGVISVCFILRPPPSSRSGSVCIGTGLWGAGRGKSFLPSRKRPLRFWRLLSLLLNG